MQQCFICGKWFRNLQAVRAHHQWCRADQDHDDPENAASDDEVPGEVSAQWPRVGGYEHKRESAREAYHEMTDYNGTESEENEERADVKKPTITPCASCRRPSCLNCPHRDERR